MMYTVTLSDGTKLKNLELNGNNFIAPGIINSAVFEGNLGRVTISDGETSETHEDMILIQNTTYGDGRSWFILAEKSPEQKEKEALEAQITALQLALVEVYERTLEV